jgi:hypothetical protein
MGDRGERGGRRAVHGGILSGGAYGAAAAMAVLGLPAMRFLETTDHDERLLLASLLEQAARYQDNLARNLAVHIVNAYAKARR